MRLRAGADGRQAAQVAVRVDAARVGARVDTRVVHARRLVAGALAVGRALRAADAVRVAVVALDMGFMIEQSTFIVII